MSGLALPPRRGRTQRGVFSEGVAVLLGGLLGGLASICGIFVIEHNVTQREKDSRFREERRAAYVELLVSGMEIVNSPVAPSEEREKVYQAARARLVRALEEIRLIGADQVVKLAENAEGQCRILVDNAIARGKCGQALDLFRNGARTELNNAQRF